jgi:aryl-alcohol dehydrogenase-like predicted oxidoreductase
MRQVRLGQTEVKVSAVAVGTSAFGDGTGDLDYSAVVETIVDDRGSGPT